MILDCAVRIYNSKNIEKKKESNLDKPTEKQINLLNKLKIKIPSTKKEATVLIRENLKEDYKEY
jgi:hypothetical protein